MPKNSSFWQFLKNLLFIYLHLKDSAQKCNF